LPYQDALGIQAVLGRGTFIGDSGDGFTSNQFRILSSKVTRFGKSMPGRARLTNVMESISFDTPPDDFWIEASDMNLNIIKNPRYFSALYPTSNNTMFGGLDDFTATVGAGNQTATVAQVKMAVIRAIQTYQDSPFYPSSNPVNGEVQNNIIKMFVSGIVPIQINGSTQQITITGGSTVAQNACALAVAAGGEIIQNIWYQEDAPYFPVIILHYVQHFFFSPWINPGCYIEDPINVVPDYFMNPISQQQTIPNSGNDNEQPADGSSTIFDLWATFNPQYFSDDGTPNGNFIYSALRMCDTVRFNRTWSDLDQSWMLASVGAWNSLIFSGGNRPTQPSDYAPLQ
jgi:hypothetical protein